jgi:hypothetical protein
MEMGSRSGFLPILSVSFRAIIELETTKVFRIRQLLICTALIPEFVKLHAPLSVPFEKAWGLWKVPAASSAWFFETGELSRKGNALSQTWIGGRSE